MMYCYVETEMHYILVVRCMKVETRRGVGNRRVHSKCPMWNWEQVEGTGRVTDVYYVAWEAESVLWVG